VAPESDGAAAFGSASLAGRTVLAVFAHPDDESLACGGTLARLADEGVRVVLLCASHGERGSSADPAVPRGPDLGRVRECELLEAAKVLGISEVILLDHPDGEIRWRNVEQLQEQIAQAITDHTPDLVITFDEDGLYWHLDHIGVHERTATAVKSFGSAAPPLYYVTIPHGVMREVTNAAVANGWVPPGSTMFGITPDAFGLAAEPHDLTVNVGHWVPRKLQALQCHRTQMGPGNPFARLDAAQAMRWLAIERFRREPINTCETLLDRIGEPTLHA
jgi:LmbE family N-acetylglucosaminyl deacetylase